MDPNDDPLLDGLNPEQLQAVASTAPLVLTIAGAGAGKTSVLARRVVRLLRSGVPPQYILCLTFTRKAAEEMRTRIGALLEAYPGARRSRLPEIRTLHSWGASLIRRYAESVGRTRWFSIYDEQDAEDVLRAVAGEIIGVKATTARLETLRRDPRIIDGWRERLAESNALTYDQIEELTLHLLHTVARDEWTAKYRHILIDEYQDTNLAQVAIVNRLAPPSLFIVGDPRQSIYRFRGAEVATIVDRARDASYEVIELTANYRSVPGVVRLANALVDGDWKPMTSTRSAASAASPPCAELRRDKEQLVRWLCRAEDHGYRWSDCAVLGRTWRQLEELRELLEERGIPCVFYGPGPVDPWSTEDGRNLARALLLALNPSDDSLASLLIDWGSASPRFEHGARVLRAQARRERRTLLEVMASTDNPWNVFRAGIVTWEAERLADRAVAPVAEEILECLGVIRLYERLGLSSRLETLRACVASFSGAVGTMAAFAEWWTDRGIVDRGAQPCPDCKGTGGTTDEHGDGEPCPVCGGSGKRQGVHVMTVHAAKGLEWPVVAVVDVRDGVYPSDRSTEPEDRAEDLRVLYVAVTRARDRLAIVVPTTYSLPWAPGQTRAARPSPFLDRPGVRANDDEETP